MGRWTLAATIVATSAAVLSAALAFWLANPAVADFFDAGVPQIYGSVASWLTPPYLYLIINGIIISIAATSRYQKTVVVESQQTDFPVEETVFQAGVLDPPTGGDGSTSFSETEEPEKDEFVISSFSWSPIRVESKEPRGKSVGNSLVEDKPLVSARLGRRRSVKTSPEGKALGVARPRKNETLESTWRALTEGRAVPLARHLKKSDTWATHARAAVTVEPSTPPAKHDLEKFETFTARSPVAATSSPPSSGAGYSSPVPRLRREFSMGHDDLNRRVEAFIKKFNEDMRLQRQESLQKYKAMINRGSH